MKRTNTPSDALNRNKAVIDPGDGLPLIELPLDGNFGGGKGDPGEGVPTGGAPLQVVRKNVAGTSTEWATLTKDSVGLSSVDNTADADKPVSAAVASALEGKANAYTTQVALGWKADLDNGKVPRSQLPTDALVTDANVAAVVDGAQTGPAIDARINTQVTPVVEQITADYIASDQVVIDAAAAAVDANPTIATLEADKWFKGDFSNFEQDFNSYTTTGVRGILTTAATNMPVASIGVLKVYKVGSGAIQEYTTWAAIPRTYWRRLVSGSWGAWSEGSLVGRIDTLEADKWKRGTLSGGTDFNNVFTPGEHTILSTAHPNSPEAVLGALEVLPVNTWFIQRYTTTSASPVTYLRRYTSSWSAWVKQPARAELDVLTSRIGALEDSGSQAGKSGMKVVPLTMTAPGTPLSTTTDKGAVRWARRYAVMPKRVRVHVANANTGNALKGNQALSLTHIRVGVGDEDGGYTNGVIAQAGGALPSDGSEVVTPWTTVPELEDGGYLTITVGWYGGGGTATLQNNQGGGWTTTDHALAGSSTTTEWTRSKTTPLHCWIEAEVPASTPVVLGHGDSITVGTATTDPVGDSWAAQYAYDNGALPVILAMHGSAMSGWASGASRWKQYGTFDLNAVVDAIVTTLGQNDLPVTEMDLATLQSRHTTFMAALRGIFPKQPVYLGAITPSNKNATLEQLRRDFNAWRAEPAQHERGVLDFATAVGGPADEDLLPEYSADGLHPNTVGQAVMAGVVEAVPVTPFTLSPAKLRALSVL